MIIPLTLLKFYYKLTYILEKLPCKNSSLIGAANHVFFFKLVINEKFKLKKRLLIFVHATRTPEF